MKKYILIFLFTFIISLTLVACSSKKTNESTTTTKEETTTTISDITTTSEVTSTTKDSEPTTYYGTTTDEGEIIITTINPEYLDLSVRDAIGNNGVVAAANPYAALAGITVMQQGGNAFDAAVAVSFALGVCEPNASGIGGGGIMVGYNASTGSYVSYNFREFLPGAANAATYQELGGVEVLDYGINSVGVPTQVLGLLAINEDLGNLSRQDVMAPAISYARNGINVTPELATAIRDSFNHIMDSRKETVFVFTDEDGLAPIAEGELLVQEDYAHSLELISELGVDGFYKGEIAEAILDAMVKQGGLITQADLDYAVANYPIIETPVTGTYKGYDIVSATTPSSGGIILIETLNMLEQYGDIASLGRNSAEYINVLATALQLAYGDKQHWIADSKFENVPIKGLLSKQYAAERWSKYRVGQAYLGKITDGKNYGDPWPYNGTTQKTSESAYTAEGGEHYSTTAFSCADKEGNIVSITQTINHFFGSGVVPHGCGFFLNNQLSSFSLTPTSAAYVKPYKQPVSHIMPTIVTKDGDPVLTLGSPGSMRIPSAVVQTLVNFIDFHMNIQDAITADRIFVYATGGQDDYSSLEDGKHIKIEKCTPELKLELEAMGYYVEVYNDINLYFGGVHAISFDMATGTMHGGADPRRDGKAIGY